MSLQRDDAVVVHSLRLGEADRIVTFCTPKFGRIRAVAKGSRRPKSRLSGSLELFNRGELVFVLRPHRDLHHVRSFDVKVPYGTHIQDPVGFAYASYFAELAFEFSAEQEESPSLFALLEEALGGIIQARGRTSFHAMARAFELRLLSLSGHRPRLEGCVLCDDSVNGPEVPFGLSWGGLLCARHASRDRTLLLHAETLALMRAWITVPLTEARQLPPRQDRELRWLLSSLMAQRLEKSLHTLEYAEKLEEEMTP